MPFDFAAAKADGVSDAQIAEYLASKSGFDIAAARKNGVADAEIVNYLKDIAAQPSVMQKAPNAQQSVEPSGATERFLRSAKNHLMDLPHGFQQRIGQRTQQQEDVQRALQAPLESTTAGKVGAIAGQAIPAVVGSAAMGPGATILGTIGKMGIAGGIQGLLTPTGAGEDTSTNVLQGAVGNALLGGLTHGVSRLITPNPNVNPQNLDLLDRARAMGINPLPSQVTGSKLGKSIENFANASTDNKPAINRTAAQLIGAPAGTDALPPATIDAAFAANRAARHALIANTTVDTRSPDFIRAANDFAQHYYAPDVAVRNPALRSYIDMIQRWIDQGHVDGQMYSETRNRLSKLARTNSVDQSDYGRLVDVLDAGIQNRPQWQALNAQYRALKAFDKPNVVTPAGDVNANVLYNGVGAQSGNHPVADLAAVGKQFPSVSPKPVTDLVSLAKRFGTASAIGGAAGGGASYFYGARDPQELATTAAIGGGLGLGLPFLLRGMLSSPYTTNYLARGLRGLGGTGTTPDFTPFLTPLSPFAGAAKIQQTNDFMRQMQEEVARQNQQQY